MRPSAIHQWSPLVELWSLREDTLVEREGSDVLVATRWADTRIDSPAPEVSTALRLMSLGPVSLDHVIPGFSGGGRGAESPPEAQLRAVLERLGNTTIRSLATADGRLLLSAVPISAYAVFRPQLPLADRLHRLSRFATIRSTDDRLVLESPLSYHRVDLHDTQASCLAARLGTPVSAVALAAKESLAEQDLRRVLGYLAAAGVVIEADLADADRFREDDDPVLAGWSPYELMLHARSRLGRHDLPFGDVRNGGGVAPEPGPSGRPGLTLHKPEVAELIAADPSLSNVLGDRRSIRQYGRSPITVGQIGTLLHRTARITNGHRTYPSLGAAYPLRLYLLVNSCDGLAPGAYRYMPDAHELQVIQGTADAQAEVLQQAQAFAGLSALPPVVIVMTAEFGRIATHKGLAYSCTLKEVGALQQTLYLVCTAMGLAPCALAGGDSDASARALGLDWASEPTVGEFIVGPTA
jgi:SagB-type dehydrogenase family enzyme